MESSVGERIIVLVDMDCFYVQVEQKLCPGYDNKPCAVVQYNTWQGGGIIAVNYEARARGVKRGMRGDESKKLCPDIHNFRVPEVRGKADLTKYREAGASVIDVLCEFCDCVERASIDEAYLDLTSEVSKKMKDSEFDVCASQIPNTFVVGWNKECDGDDVQSWLESLGEDHMISDKKLAVAAVIVEEIRMAVYNKTKFKCSAGIAHNKMLAKLVCGLHKPNKQTVMPHSSVPILYSSLPINKIRNLGGKFGDEVKRKLNVNTVGDLSKFSETQLCSNFGEKTGSWLHLVSKGIEHEPVTARQLPKSIGCGKNFPGQKMLDTKSKVSHWMLQMAAELNERLQKDQLDNRRFAKSLTVSVKSKDEVQNSVGVSRTCPIHIYDTQKLAHDALHAIQKLNTASPSSLLWKPPILSLAMSASKFEDKLDFGLCSIDSYFTTAKKSPIASNIASDKHVDETDTSPFNNKKKLMGTINGYFNKHTFSLTDHDDMLIKKQKVLESTSTETVYKVGILSDSSMNDEFNENLIDTDIITVQSPKLQNIVTNTVSNRIDKDDFDTLNNKAIDRPATGNSIDENLQFEKNCESENTQYSNGFFAKKFKEKGVVLEVNSPEIISVVNDIENPPMEASVAEHDSQIKNDGSSSMLSCNSDCIEEKRMEDDEKSVFEKESDNLLINLESPGSSKSIEKCAILDLLSEQHVEACDSKQNETDLPSELLTVCVKCNQNIPVWEELEHSDYHMALDMQNGLTAVRSMDVSPSSRFLSTTSKVKTSNKKSFTRTSHKRKKNPKQNINTLDNFFK